MCVCMYVCVCTYLKYLKQHLAYSKCYVLAIIITMITFRYNANA